MKMRIAFSLLVVFLGVSIGGAGLVLPQPRRTKQDIAGFRERSYVETFKANEPALVMASGVGRTCLAVYVFDAEGNCVAKDDRGTPETADDLVTEWIPTEQARYSIEIRNAGYSANEYHVSVR